MKVWTTKNKFYFNSVAQSLHLICFSWTPELHTIWMQQPIRCKTAINTTVLPWMDCVVHLHKQWRSTLGNSQSQISQHFHFRFFKETVRKHLIETRKAVPSIQGNQLLHKLFVILHQPPDRSAWIVHPKSWLFSVLLPKLHGALLNVIGNVQFLNRLKWYFPSPTG